MTRSLAPSLLLLLSTAAVCPAQAAQTPQPTPTPTPAPVPTPAAPTPAPPTEDMPNTHDDGPDPARLVQPIDWSRFDTKDPAAISGNADMQEGARLLRSAVRYNLKWMADAFPFDATQDMYIVPPSGAQDGIRAPASAAYGVAVAIVTGAYDETAEGLSRDAAVRRTARMIKGVAAAHKVAGQENGWGDAWQSAFWTTLLGQSGWMLWDDLDDDTRSLLAEVVTHEADRFIQPGYAVPYWIGSQDKVNFPGDTKAEENAWNATLLQLAVAMEPTHPHAAAWKKVGSELMVSAFTFKSDRDKNICSIDGQPVRSWLHGYNVRDDGAVVNHGILHPDYTVTPTLNLRAYLVQSLAGQTISQAAAFNADRLYRALEVQKYKAPPYKAPGGTIYQPGKAEVYYPQGTDWSRYRFDIYYLYDVYADLFGWDHTLPHKAREWMHLRARRMAAMQARHTDGSLYAPGEFDRYQGREQMAAWQLGDAYLLQWLHARHALSPVGNWLTASATTPEAASTENTPTTK